MAFSSVLEPSSYLLGVLFWLLGILCAEVDDAWDDFWRGSFVKWLYLAAKTSHVGGRCGWVSLPPAPTYGT
jgi:hypothetical protein